MLEIGVCCVRGGRRIAETNLRLVSPDLPDVDCQALAKQAPESAGRAVMEIMMAWFMSERRVHGAG